MDAFSVVETFEAGLFVRRFSLTELSIVRVFVQCRVLDIGKRTVRYVESDNSSATNSSFSRFKGVV